MSELARRRLSAAVLQRLDVAPDGRLLLLRRESQQPATRLDLMVNWFEEVRRLKLRSAQ